MSNKLCILFEGWPRLPHSYSIVLCFQLKYLIKKYNISFYIKEVPYYFKHWSHKKMDYKFDENQFFSDLKNGIINDKYIYNNNDNDIDIIYRISFPYNITNSTKPTCVFYTSEFGILDDTYFLSSNVINFQHFQQNMYFTSPSKWSQQGLTSYINDDKNEIITHGVDPDFYYIDNDSRILYRKKLSINDNDIILCSVGAMTGSKGIVFIIILLFLLLTNGNFNINTTINDLVNTHYKLILKGTSDLYQSKEMVMSYINVITMSDKCKQYIIDNNIIFITETLTFDQLRSIYNCSDIYVSPYIAEGFNLCPLEALACGTSLIISKTGSTSDYINDIITNTNTKHISLIDTKVISRDNKMLNSVEVDDIVTSYNNLINNTNIHSKNYELSNYVLNNYSWSVVADKLYNYLTKNICNNIIDNIIDNTTHNIIKV